MKKTKIVAITTDPYYSLQGFSLVFIRLFDFLQKKNTNLDINLISNDGICSKLVDNNKFLKIKLNPKSNLLFKTFLLTHSFVKIIKCYEQDTTLIANSEIPELLSAFILKIKFKKVYCIIQDLRLRDQSFKIKLIHKLRLFLIRRIKNVIFTNRYTMSQLNGPINKFYIGNPIF